MSLENLDLIQHIVVHANCPDGMASAMILLDALPGRKVSFVQVGKAIEELPAEPGMLFCDICPPAARAQEFVDLHSIVLDHHRANKDTVALFGERGFFADETMQPGISGAMLAFRYVWLNVYPIPPSAAPDPTKALWERFVRIEQFARLAGVRDTWQQQSPFWKAACDQASRLMFLTPSYLLGRRLVEILRDWTSAPDVVGSMDEAIEVGRRAKIEDAIKNHFLFVTDAGLRVAVVPSTSVTSDVSDAMHDVDVVAGFKSIVEDRTDGRVHAPKRVARLVWSLRSRGKFDCCTFAKALGGGGHTKAAGFSCDHADPYAMIIGVFRTYEEENRSR